MVILLLIWAAVVGSIYSNFLVFYSNFSESTNYHKAYYAAISALERGELVTKQRQPWYCGCGWRRNYGSEECFCRSHANQSDKKISSNNFSYLSDNDSNVYRSINSRTNRIPALPESWVWQWDVEPLLQSDDSDKYNMMDYENSQIFLLYYDNPDTNNWTSYTKASEGDYTRSQANSAIWHIRLPKYLYDKFWNLNTDSSLVEWYEYSDKNDVIVDRQIKWIYNNEQFTIYSTQNSNATSLDTSMREWDINWNGLYFDFWNKNSRSPIFTASRDPSDSSRSTANIKKGQNSDPITIGKAENYIKWKSNYSSIFSDSNISQIQLRFSLLNLLKAKKNSTDTSEMLYPFLEYYIKFVKITGGSAEDAIVADKYYTINAEWYYGGYKINKKVWKPTVKESVLSSFTSIFK